jgi:hypothetical protein
VHRSKREIEELIAELAPRPDAPAVIRRLPARRDSGPEAEPLPAERPGPMLQERCDVSPGRVESSDPRTNRIGRDAFQLRPDGDLAAIVDRLVTDKLERIEARRFAKTGRPRIVIEGAVPAHSSRRVPAAVRRAGHERDGNRCGYVDDSGRRWSERHRLEYHHRHPYGMGGGHSVKNMGLVCRTHTAYLAELDSGREAMARHRAKRQSSLNKHPTG